jgi:colicin import membrane protein
VNALVNIETITAEKLFAPGGVEEIVSKLETDVRAMERDITTDSGRAEIKSTAYKIARSKTALDELGKDFVAALKKEAGKIDADRRIIKDRLDALKDEFRKPLTDWEQAEGNRVKGHEDTLQAIREAAQIGLEASSITISDRLRTIRETAQRDWQEYGPRADQVIAESEEALRAALAAAGKREAEAAELARFREAQAAQAQAEREARIAAEAADSARIAAENKAARDAAEKARAIEVERLLIEQENAAAVARAEQAERQAKEAAEKAERDARAAAEKAEQDRIIAIEQERARATAEAKRIVDEAAARERDTKHKRAVNNGAVAALMAGGIAEDAAKLAVTLIAKRQIPAITIAY